MSKSFLMGNEAIGLGAIRAGVRVVSGYPGTPSTEVLETVAKHNPGDIYVEWSVNEKAGMEVAAAAAYTGARTMVTMKQVGLNVASDPLMSLAYVGVKGGMVVMVADDPGPISSQTEQDTRCFGQFSKLPVSPLPVPPLPIRPPVLCAGCPHRASFYAVKRAMEKLNRNLAQGQKPVEGIYCGDIGCYTLGNAKPLDMVDTCLCMGAGITMAQGMQRVEPDKRYFSFVGDSTFFASGLTGIVNAVYNEANLTLCILDNSTTAMTGHQPHPGTGHTMMGQVVDKIDITKVLEGIGVRNIVTVDALDLDQCVDAVLEISAKKGVGAVIFKAPALRWPAPSPPGKCL